MQLSEIIRNTEGLYLGNLESYFRAVFFCAQNVRNPYHNFRHMLNVTCQCYDACVYYKDKLSSRDMRNLLIAAIFHDFNHSGQTGDDDLNVERAVRAMRKHLRGRDYDFVDRIEQLIRETEYPYKIPSEKMDLSGQILRDADLSQALDTVWIQQVVFGLSQEWGKTPLEVLEGQAIFHDRLTFATDWAKQKFPKSVIDQKVAEATELLAILKVNLAHPTD